jgi:inorganic triphosphatase YgiF
MDGHEIELKLAVQPADLARLRRHSGLKALRLGRPTTRQLTSVYFDTPTLALSAQGITVRVRQVGRTHLQTVKTAGDRTAGLFCRREWESPVTGDSPEAASLRATGLPALNDPEVLTRLQPIFATDIRRTTMVLGQTDGEGKGWEVEAAFDQGTVTAGSKVEPISEVEFELVRGETANLFALARQVTEAVPARLLALSKSDRGMLLAKGEAPQPFKAAPLALDPEMSVGDAFQAIGRSCLAQILANERCLLATGDGEAIHQMRVALRRLRSAIKVFRDVVNGPSLATARADLAWLLTHLGPARDAEVFLAEIIDPVVEQHPNDPALADLRRTWQADWEQRLIAARQAVDDRRFTALLLDLGTWIETGDWLSAETPLRSAPLAPFAKGRLRKANRALRRAGSGDLTKLAPPSLHRVRILCKQLRYTGEFFAALCPRKPTRAFLAALAEVQDRLGLLNDIAVAEPKLGASRAEGARAWATGLVAGWHQGRRPQLMAEAEQAWQAWRRCHRPWKK